MSPKVAKHVIVVGFVGYAVMCVFLVLALMSWANALDRAEVAIHGDITGVRIALARAFQLRGIGGLFGLVGYVLLFIGVMKGAARARWIYYGGLAFSISYLVMFPIGTILGVCGIIHFLRHKHEYFPQVNPIPVA